VAGFRRGAGRGGEPEFALAEGCEGALDVRVGDVGEVAGVQRGASMSFVKQAVGYWVRRRHLTLLCRQVGYVRPM
jgi:hypothetical protein